MKMLLTAALALLMCVTTVHAQGGPFFSFTQLPVGDANCPTGGLQINVGQNVGYICNGEAGPTGDTGEIGSTGAQGPQGDPGSGGVWTWVDASGQEFGPVAIVYMDAYDPYFGGYVDGNGLIWSVNSPYGSLNVSGYSYPFYESTDCTGSEYSILSANFDSYGGVKTNHVYGVGSWDTGGSRRVTVLEGEPVVSRTLRSHFTTGFGGGCMPGTGPHGPGPHLTQQLTAVTTVSAIPGVVTPLYMTFK